jgi:periplasmic divalent cation tolerance protein
MTVHLVYITAGSREEARRIGQALVAERLAACANILEGMHSIYWWEGNLEEADEAGVIAKTRHDKLEALTARVRALHSYDCPCVVALPISAGNPAYLQWIAAETG